MLAERIGVLLHSISHGLFLKYMRLTCVMLHVAYLKFRQLEKFFSLTQFAQIVNIIRAHFGVT